MVKSFGQNFVDAPEIVKFEKAREVLDSLSCLRLLGSGFKVLGSKKAQRKKLKADRPEQILRRLESREASRPEGGKVQPNAITKIGKGGRIMDRRFWPLAARCCWSGRL